MFVRLWVNLLSGCVVWWLFLLLCPVSPHQDRRPGHRPDREGDDESRRNDGRRRVGVGRVRVIASCEFFACVFLKGNVKRAADVLAAPQIATSLTTSLVGQ